MTISSALFWEILLVTLRGTIIHYAKKRKRACAINNNTRQLEARIENLDRKISTGQSTIADFHELVNLNNNLIELRKEELKGAWLEHGEKPSKLFLNLENKKQNQ